MERFEAKQLPHHDPNKYLDDVLSSYIYHLIGIPIS